MAAACCKAATGSPDCAPEPSCRGLTLASTGRGWRRRAGLALSERNAGRVNAVGTPWRPGSSPAMTSAGAAAAAADSAGLRGGPLCAMVQTAAAVLPPWGSPCQRWRRDPTPGAALPPRSRICALGPAFGTAVANARPAPEPTPVSQPLLARPITRTIQGRMSPVFAANRSPRPSASCGGNGRSDGGVAPRLAWSSSLRASSRRRPATSAPGWREHRSSPFNDQAYADRLDSRGRNPRGGAGR